MILSSPLLLGSRVCQQPGGLLFHKQWPLHGLSLFAFSHRHLHTGVPQAFLSSVRPSGVFLRFLHGVRRKSNRSGFWTPSSFVFVPNLAFILSDALQTSPPPLSRSPLVLLAEPHTVLDSSIRQIFTEVTGRCLFLGPLTRLVFSLLSLFLLQEFPLFLRVSFSGLRHRVFAVDLDSGRK